MKNNDEKVADMLWRIKALHWLVFVIFVLTMFNTVVLCALVFR